MPEEELIAEKPPGRYPGIRIIAAFFILDALWIFYDIARVWLSGQCLEYPSIYGAIPLFSLIGGIGLWHKRGWGRNFGLASSYILLLRGLPYLLSCWVKHDTGYLVGAIFSFLLALSTGSYLYRKPIRRIFPQSPASLSFVGFTLALYGFTQQSGGTGVIYLCYVLALAGVIIGVRAVWLTNNSEGGSRSRSEDADASSSPGRRAAGSPAHTHGAPCMVHRSPLARRNNPPISVLGQHRADDFVSDGWLLGSTLD